MDLALLVAIYAALLSTILGIREFLKERRRILIILEYVAFYERAQLRIVNTGHRPITITKVGMSLLMTQDSHKYWEDVPANSVLGSPFDNSDEGEELVEPLPAVVQDGEQVTLPLSGVVSMTLLENGMKAEIFVYDVEGKVYKKYKRMLYNPKWGRYDPIPDGWK